MPGVPLTRAIVAHPKVSLLGPFSMNVMRPIICLPQLWRDPVHGAIGQLARNALRLLEQLPEFSLDRAQLVQPKLADTRPDRFALPGTHRLIDESAVSQMGTGTCDVEGLAWAR